MLLPGGSRNGESPLLAAAGRVVASRGGDVRRVTWTGREHADWPAWPSANPQFSGPFRAWLTAQVAQALDDVVTSGAAAPVVIGKSLGSLAARLAVGRGLAMVWFTPVLTDKLTVSALRAAAAPCLLAGGTADALWDGQVARSVTAHVVEVDGADHSMAVPGEPSASAATITRVMTALGQFLDREVWR